MMPTRRFIDAGRRHNVLAAFTAALGVLGVSLTATAAASADSATGFNGMVTLSVPPPVVAGVASTYTLTFLNTTSSPLTNVVASGSLPSGVTVKSIGGCARLGGNQSQTVLCSMPDLQPGATDTATFSIVASAVGTAQLQFGASGGAPVPGDPGALQGVGDFVILPVSVQPGPTDIQVTGSSNNGAPPIGSSFNYAFQVKDDGPLPAAGVTFDDPLPATILLGGTITVDNGTCIANVITNAVHCDIGNLNVGQQSDIAFAATPTAPGVFADTAKVAMAGADTHPANDQFTVTVQPK
jgi:uncharacterized repeat protein (TIGR01451 family)